jgi:ribosomal protein L37E
MGGFGSTRWGWTSTKGTVEGARSLDINRLNKAGCLRPGYWGGWQWTRDGERIADIGLRAEEGRLILSYRIRRDGGEWRNVEQPTPVVWVPCPFGGERPYFICPGLVNGIACRRRVAKLYGAATHFLCRHCYRLAYASQREDCYDRALSKANRIRMRLGGEPGMTSMFPERPKGMHQRTYEHLQSEVEKAEMLADERLSLVVARLQRMERRSGGRSRRRPSKEFWR